MKGAKDFTWKTGNISQTKSLTNKEFDVILDLDTEDNSMVGFVIVLKRKPVMFIFTYFIPCGLLVIISFISFAIKYDAVPGRLGLLLTVLLMIINMNNSLISTIPSSDTVCTLTLWTIFSIGFISIALAEYFVLLVVTKFSINTKVKDRMEGKVAEGRRKEDLWAHRVDRAALTILPVVYLLFAAIFFFAFCV